MIELEWGEPPAALRGRGGSALQRFIADLAAALKERPGVSAKVPRESKSTSFSSTLRKGLAVHGEFTVSSVKLEPGRIAHWARYDGQAAEPPVAPVPPPTALRTKPLVDRPVVDLAEPPARPVVTLPSERRPLEPKAAVERPPRAGEPVLECRDCDDEFGTTGGLQAHTMRVHHRRPTVSERRPRGVQR